MVALSSLLKSQIRFHLGYSPAIPSGDRAYLEALMDNVADQYLADKIAEIVTRCETAFAETAPTAGTLVETERENVTESTIKDTVVSKRDSDATRQRTYQREANILAAALGVKNYRDEQVLRNADIDYSSYDPIYINQLPIAGVTGQVLAKKSPTDYDLEWRSFGGTAGSAIWGAITGSINNQADLIAALNQKLEESALKTINNISLVGSGNITAGAGTWGAITGSLSNQTDLTAALNQKLEESELKTINNVSLVGSGNITIESENSQIPILIRQCF